MYFHSYASLKTYLLNLEFGDFPRISGSARPGPSAFRPGPARLKTMISRPGPARPAGRPARADLWSKWWDAAGHLGSFVFLSVINDLQSALDLKAIRPANVAMTFKLIIITTFAQISR